MSYIVVGLFPTQLEADKVLLKLENAGYNDYNLSHSHQEIVQKVDIDKKNGFWNSFHYVNNMKTFRKQNLLSTQKFQKNDFDISF